jgi:outer membrane protein TolC
MNRRACRVFQTGPRFAVATALVLFAGIASAQSVLMLREAVTLATARDPRIREADAKQAQAAAEAGVLGARFGPAVFTGAGAVYTYGFPQTPGGAPPSLFSLGMTQTLFDVIARGEKRAGTDRLEIGRLTAGGVRDAVTVEAVVTYLELATVRRVLERQRSAVISGDRMVDLMTQRLQEGRALPADVLQARLAAARIAQRIVQLEGRELVLDGQLHLLTGLPLTQPVIVSFEELPLLPDRSVVELVVTAAARDPNVKSAELELSARANILAGQQVAYWPAVDLIGNYAVFTKFNNFDRFFSQYQRHNVNVGVEAKVPLFNAARGPAVALARSQLLEAEAASRRQREAIELTVRQALQQANDATAARKVAEIDLAAAQETVRVTQARATEGRADRLDMEKALVEEGRAWDGFLTSQMEQQRGQLHLRRITGELGRLFP